MTGILLINLGTPQAPTRKAVRKYLREFLSDPLVIDINPIFRWLLVHLIIAPFRSFKSAIAYQKIWTKGGSPLLTHTKTLGEKVSHRLGDNYVVEVAMRYGEPSIALGLNRLIEKGATTIKVLPLYPQYALSTSQSSVDAVEHIAKKNKIGLSIEYLPPFYDHPLFIRSHVEVATPYLLACKPDMVLFSFHGLPERHITKVDESGVHCLQTLHCCDKIQFSNQKCYRAQSFKTASLMAHELGLKEGEYLVSFQSRLGKGKWIKPYTSKVLVDLAKGGHKKVLVIFPSFVTDCLETLEEIDIRERESFLENGGQEFQLVPSLNSHPRWIEAICAIVIHDKLYSCTKSTNAIT